MKGSIMLWVLGIPIVLIAAAFLYWQLRSAPQTYRYKMTVEVMTPDGLRTGFAVRQVQVSSGNSWLPLGESRGSHYRLKGEAVAVDLPSGETLFALLSGARGEIDYSSSLPSLAFGAMDDRAQSTDPVELWPRPPSNPKFGLISPLPMFVIFRDISDPTSVERVDPHNLSSVFGEGVSLKRVTVQMTDEAVTSKIGRKLVWIDEFSSYRTSPDNPFTNTLPREISGLRSQ